MPPTRSLTRADLENDRLREMFCKAYPGEHVLSPDQLEASLAATLESGPGGDVWLFGYGSLIWNPCVHYAERVAARLHGYHRSFCLWSRMGRGSPDRPGLVLGLDGGGSCHGVAFRLNAGTARDELRLLWRREMVVGSYCPRWVKLDAGERGIQALAFVVNRRHPGYAGRLPVETVVRTLVSARGQLGTPAEYLIETVRGLREHGMRDAYLWRLARLVARHDANEAARPTGAALTPPV